jgi:tetratricopeptide (TPR) repeat protein
LLKRNAKDPVALLLLAMVHEQSADFTRAQATYDRLLELEPHHTAALNNAACLYAYRLGEINRGIELARRAREQSPYDPFTADTLGWILHLRGEYATALAFLQESAKQLPSEPEVLFHLGMTHYMMGEEVPALTFLERAVESKKAGFAARDEAGLRIALIKLDSVTAGPDAIKSLENRIAEQPGDPIAGTRLAAVYARAGQSDKAIAVCERVLRSNRDVVRLLVQLASLYSEHRHEPERALDYARAARQLAPDSPRVAYELGRVAFQSRDHKWAYHLLQDAVRKQPDSGEVIAAAGWAAYGVGRVSEAEAFMQRAIHSGLDQGSSNAVHQFLAMSALVKDPAKIATAAAQIQSALSAHPNDVPTLMVVGMAHRRGGRIEEAGKVYERVLALYPEFTPAMKSLSAIYLEQDANDRKAFELASKAREANPGDSELSRTMGILAYRLGDFPVAVRLLKEVSTRVTNDAAVFYYLGMAHSRLQQLAESRRALRRALELDANFPLAAEARKAMAEPE